MDKRQAASLFPGHEPFRGNTLGMQQAIREHLSPVDDKVHKRARTKSMPATPSRLHRDARNLRLLSRAAVGRCARDDFSRAGLNHTHTDHPARCRRVAAGDPDSAALLMRQATSAVVSRAPQLGVAMDGRLRVPRSFQVPGGEAGWSESGLGPTVRAVPGRVVVVVGASMALAGALCPGVPPKCCSRRHSDPPSPGSRPSQQGAFPGRWPWKTMPSGIWVGNGAGHVRAGGPAQASETVLDFSLHRAGPVM